MLDVGAADVLDSDAEVVVEEEMVEEMVVAIVAVVDVDEVDSGEVEGGVAAGSAVAVQPQSTAHSTMSPRRPDIAASLSRGLYGWHS